MWYMVMNHMILRQIIILILIKECCYEKKCTSHGFVNNYNITR